MSRCSSPTAADLIEQRPRVLSKIKFNGVGGTQTYLGFTYFGVPSFSKHQSAGDVQ
jgi:hypothetical protein